MKYIGHKNNLVIQQGDYGTIVVVIDNLSVSLNPQKATIFQQSKVRAITELSSMLKTVNVLRHNPMINTNKVQYGYSQWTYGFFGHPFNKGLPRSSEDIIEEGMNEVNLIRRFNDDY